MEYETFFCYENRKLRIVIIIIVISVFVVQYSFLIISLAQHDLHVFNPLAPVFYI
jgi:hypothetical protein